MSLEQFRAKAEDIKTRVQTRISELKGGSQGLFGSSGGILKGGGLLKNVGAGGGMLKGLTTGPMISSLREKGVLTTATDRLRKLRGGGQGAFSKVFSSGSGEKASFEPEGSPMKIVKRRLAIEA